MLLLYKSHNIFENYENAMQVLLLRSSEKSIKTLKNVDIGHFSLIGPGSEF